MEPVDPYAESFDTFMREWLGPAVRYCTVLSKDPELAEEVVQVVFVSMFRNQNKPWQTANPRAYLLRAVRNQLIDERKHPRRHGSDAGVADAIAPPANPGSEESNLTECLMRLTDDHREALSLRYFDSLSLHEIADVMDRSVGAVNKLLARAKTGLRAELLKYGVLNPSDDLDARRSR